MGRRDYAGVRNGRIPAPDNDDRPRVGWEDIAGRAREDSRYPNLVSRRRCLQLMPIGAALSKIATSVLAQSTPLDNVSVAAAAPW